MACGAASNVDFVRVRRSTLTSARDFANPLHALNFALQDDASTLAAVSGAVRQPNARGISACAALTRVWPFAVALWTERGPAKPPGRGLIASKTSGKASTNGPLVRAQPHQLARAKRLRL